MIRKEGKGKGDEERALIIRGVGFRLAPPALSRVHSRCQLASSGQKVWTSSQLRNEEGASSSSSCH